MPRKKNMKHSKQSIPHKQSSPSATEVLDCLRKKGVPENALFAAHINNVAMRLKSVKPRKKKVKKNIFAGKISSVKSHRLLISMGSEPAHQEGDHTTWKSIKEAPWSGGDGNSNDD